MTTKTGFGRPTFEEILARTRAEYTARIVGGDPLLARGVLPVLPYIDAQAAHVMHAHLDWVAAQSHPLHATAWLDDWGYVWSVARNPAAYAAGLANFTGVDGAEVPAGAVVRTVDGLEYIVDAAVIVAAGVAAAAVTALVAGLAGNAAVGVQVSLSSPVAGLTSAAVVAAGGISGGVDIEADEAYRLRILDRIAQPPHGGADFDYIKWALAVPGVTRAWVYPKELGLGAVTVRVMMDDAYADGLPLAGDVTAVQAALDADRPVTADLTVAAPIPKLLNLQISGLNPLTQAVKDAVVAEVRDLIRREAAPGGTLLISHIREAISIAADEVDHVLVAPVADVAHATGEIAIFGVTVWL